MNKEFDPNKLVVEFLQANLERLVDVTASGVRRGRNSVRAKLDRTYRAYLTRILNRYVRAKSFFIRSEPIPLYDFFVPLDLSTEQRTLVMPGAPDVASVTTSAIICGSGGSGKSMLMRHFLISTIQSGLKVPIFLELRELSQNGDTVHGSLLRSLQSNGLEVDDGYFELALRGGHFCILLDGFDELELSAREDIAKQIEDLSVAYPGNWLLVSSRADSALQGWSNFTQFQVDPMNLERATELVQKLPFDDPVKDQFIGDLQAGLFRRHRSFLSNPLLLSIMLLTYSDIAHIPEKLSIFYNQAYESLFQKHDALKGGFQRERRTGLDIQDFAKVFSAFCIQSYEKRDFSFSRMRALEYLDRAKAISQVSYESSLFLDDALQAVCLLLEDGLDITFAHRSFQEYFVARFIQSCPPDTKKELIERFAPDSQGESVISLLHEFDPYAVEQHYVLPAIDELRNRIGVRRKIGVTHHLRFLKDMFSEFRLDPDGELTVVLRNLPLYYTMRFAKSIKGTKSRTYTSANKRKLLARLLMKESGESGTLETDSLTTRSPFFRQLSDEGPWGIPFLQAALDAGELIRHRHDEAKASLDDILGRRVRRNRRFR